MKPSINRKKGFSIVEIDNDCEYEVFYKVANIIEQDFSCKFHKKVEGLDSIYWSFEQSGYHLTIYYNIYLGIEIYPAKGVKASTEENKFAEDFAERVFQKLILSDWEIFENEESIGQTGKGGGIIIWDREHPEGARITVEQKALSFCVLVHVFGVVLRRFPQNSRSDCDLLVNQKAFQINKFFEHENVENKRKNNFWMEKRNRILAELVLN